MKHHLKLLLLGSSGVGKTTLLRQWTSSTFAYCEPTFAIEVTSNTLRVRDNVIRVRLSDTSGREYYDSIYDGYIYNADAILLVYDTTNMDSWHKCKYWLDKVHTIVGSSPRVFIIGNKIDRESKRVVYKDDVMSVVRHSDINNIHTMECSAKSGENARYIYHMILSSLDIPEKEVWMQIDEEDNKSRCNIV